MPRSNPDRESRGGSVPGMTKGHAIHGQAPDVAASCFDPGYSLDNTFNAGDGENAMNKADLIRGYVCSGRLVGNR